MTKKVPVTWRIDQELLEKIDKLVEQRYFYNRSHLLEVAVAKLLEDIKIVKSPIIGLTNEDIEMLKKKEKSR